MIDRVKSEMKISNGIRIEFSGNGEFIEFEKNVGQKIFQDEIGYYMWVHDNNGMEWFFTYNDIIQLHAWLE